MNNEGRNLDGKVHRILIVDDEKDVLEVLAMTFRNAELFKSEISIAENAKKALIELQKHEFDLILSDFRMPKMDGIELLYKVKEKYPGILRILITGYADIDLAEKAINKGKIHHFIEKPWNTDELIFIINEELKNRT